MLDSPSGPNEALTSGQAFLDTRNTADVLIQIAMGRTVVSASRTQGRLEYISLGPGSGQCFLTCHGKNHEPEKYPD